MASLERTGCPPITISQHRAVHFLTPRSVIHKTLTVPSSNFISYSILRFFGAVLPIFSIYTCKLPSIAVMVRLSIFSLAALSVIGATASSVLDLIPENFDKVVLQSGKPALVEFFAPWCGHCKNLAPVYEELATVFDFASDKVSVAKVDADAEKSLGKRFGVQGFPTLKWFDGKSEKPEDYNGGRDLESLTEFITKKTGLKPKKAKAAVSNVEYLTDSTFKTLVGGDKHVLIAFTAPWCGRKYIYFLNMIASALSVHQPLRILLKRTNRLQESCPRMGEGCQRLCTRFRCPDRKGRLRSAQCQSHL
jgi:protein disulfide-isomerase-like protein